MTSAQIASIREYMKEFKASPVSDEFREQAETVNKLIPALVDEITDEEIESMIHQTFGFVLRSILEAKMTEKEPTSPEVTTAPVDETSNQ